MENRVAYIVFFNFCLLYRIFLLKWDFLWNHFVTQNIMINIFLPTQPPKTWQWHFVWQNANGRHPQQHHNSGFPSDIWRWYFQFCIFHIYCLTLALAFWASKLQQYCKNAFWIQLKLFLFLLFYDDFPLKFLD